MLSNVYIGWQLGAGLSVLGRRTPEAKCYATAMADTDTANTSFSESELRQRLTPEQYHVTQQAGTERAFSGEYWDCKDDGTYSCRVCGDVLFSSDAKYDSGTGWPSFFEELTAGKVERRTDRSGGMIRIEAVCANCGAHLGHIFNDGPQPTGERYCMNSASLLLETTD